MAKKVMNPGHDRAKNTSKKEEPSDGYDFEHLMVYNLGQAEAKPKTLQELYGFGFSNGYGQMPYEDFLKQIIERYRENGLSEEDSERTAEVVMLQMYDDYDELRQALAHNNLIGVDGMLIVPECAKPFGPVVFDRNLSAQESADDYLDWSQSIERDADKPMIQEDAFDPFVRYAEIAQEDATELEVDDAMDELGIQDEQDDYSLMEPLPELAHDEMTDIFEEELQRYAEGDMSAFEKQMFKNSIADGTFGEERAGLVDSLDSIAFGKYPKEESQSDSDRDSKYAALVKRGVPEALNKLPGGFDPEYQNERGVPDAMSEGIEGYQAGIDYEIQ